MLDGQGYDISCDLVMKVSARATRPDQTRPDQPFLLTCLLLLDQ